jgi:hypothetical protein
MIQRIETPRDERVESGPVVIDHCGPQGKGYDWPGVFLRGDRCMAMLPALKKIAQHYRDTATGSKLWVGVEAGYVDEIVRYIEAATAKPTPPMESACCGRCDGINDLCRSDTTD